jgi:hypothetical protein
LNPPMSTAARTTLPGTKNDAPVIYRCQWNPRLWVELVWRHRQPDGSFTPRQPS